MHVPAAALGCYCRSSKFHCHLATPKIFACLQQQRNSLYVPFLPSELPLGSCTHADAPLEASTSHIQLHVVGTPLSPLSGVLLAFVTLSYHLNDRHSQGDRGSSLQNIRLRIEPHEAFRHYMV